MPEIPEGKRTISISVYLLAWLIISLVVGTYTVTSIYWNLTRVEDRLEKKTDRLHKEITNEIKALEERVDFKYQKKPNERTN